MAGFWAAITGRVKKNHQTWNFVLQSAHDRH
jgi:hypothetical protein